jgi:hypothetical protein
MAERFFRKDVQKLYLCAGQEFHGAGIPACLLAELDHSPGGSL